MRSIPTAEQCLHYLQQNHCSQLVINHCKAVRDLALKIADKTNADKDLVEAGALLHDIGRGITHGIQHGMVGAEIAKNLELSEEIVHIIEHHLGAGIPRDEAELLGLPKKDYIPETLEEKIVAHADNLIDGNKKVSIKKEIKQLENKKKFSYANRLQKLHDELSNICGIDIDNL